MNGEVAFDLALVMAGNTFLAGSDPGEIADPGLWQSTAETRYIDCVRFEAPTGKSTFWLGPPEVADSPGAWFAFLKGEGTVGLRLRRVAGEMGRNRMLAGFSGGGEQRMIETVRADGADLWRCAWEVGRQDQEGRIWRVTCTRVARGWPAPPVPDRSLDALADDLRGALTDIKAFADSQDGLENWSEIFAGALEALAGEGEPARRLMDACAAAWVFGGMGSWNDMGFDGGVQAQYDRVSERLYALVSEGPAAAANATFTG